MRISSEPLTGRRMLDAKGLIVAPGFIDLHQHAQDVASSRLKAFDGVTTALEMEIGVPDVAAFLQKKDGRSLINYGTTASHAAARALAFGQPIHDPTIVPPSGPVTNEPATARHRSKRWKIACGKSSMPVRWGSAWEFNIPRARPASK